MVSKRLSCTLGGWSLGLGMMGIVTVGSEIIYLLNIILGVVNLMVGFNGEVKEIKNEQ